MALDIDPLFSNTSKSVKSGEVLEKKIAFCTRFLHEHISRYRRTEAEVFVAYQNVVKEKHWDFFNVSSLEIHVDLTKDLVRILNEQRSYYYLKKAYSFWIERVAPAALCSTSQKLQHSCCNLAKCIAAHLLLFAEYEKAIICLYHALQLYDKDFTSRFLLLQWLCHLGEWEVAKACMSEIRALGPNAHYDAIIKSFMFIIDVNLNDNKEPFINELLLLLRANEDCALEKLKTDDVTCDLKGKPKKPSKTFLQYQCDAIIYRYLTVAAHLPDASLEKIGDPLKNLEMSFSRVNTLIKNRYKKFADNDESFDIHEAAADNDTFLKLCSNIAEYFETATWLCREHLESGNVRECENLCLLLWFRKFRLANFPRLLPVFNLLLEVSLLSSASHFKFEKFQHVIAALQNENFQCTNNDVKSIYGEEEKIRRDQGISKTEPRALLKEHKSVCECVACYFCYNSVNCRYKLEFLKLFYERVSTNAYLKFRERFHEVLHYVKRWIAKVKEVVKLKGMKSVACRKNHCWLGIRELFLVATVRWLRINTDYDKNKEILKEALEICETTPWYHCSQWLVLRHLNRDSLKLPTKFYWLHQFANDSCISHTAEGIKKMTLHTPLGKSRMESTTRRLVKAKTSKSPGRKGRTPIRFLSDAADDLRAAEEDFNKHGHLFYREWRFLICTYLAHIYAWHEHNPWKASFMFAECCTCATRQIGRTLSNDKSLFRFESEKDYQLAVQQLPSDISVVQLFMDADRILWLIRLCHDQAPYLIPVKVLSKDDLLLARMRELLLENDDSGQLGKTSIDSKKFWKIRRDLNNRLENIISDAQNEWLGIFAPLLLPHATLTDDGYQALEQIGSCCSLSDESVRVLVETVSELSRTDWSVLLKRLACLEDVDVSIHDLVQNVYKDGQHQNHFYTQSHNQKYLLFSICPELASLPFEMFPVLGEKQRVCRIPSLYFFHRLLSRSNEIPKCVDGQKTFYVLDPGGDLTDTQNRLSKMLQQYISWKGIIGQPPKPEELRQYLQNNDFFLYMGHGSGGRYFGKSTIRSSDCRAVSVLMGCSSARIVYEGEGFDGQSVIYDYSVARCPCLVGCLWMVTDGEIDRFLMALVNYCFSNSKDKSEDPVAYERESYRLLIDAVAYARTACKLRYLTGGAVVSYGLPIVARNTPTNATSRNSLSPFFLW